MKVFINGRFLTQKTTGVQHFAKEICRELIQEHQVRILVPKGQALLDNHFNKYITKIGKLQGHLWEQISLQLFMQRNPEAVLINLCNTGPAFVRNQVVTIHDLAFLQNPKWFNPLFSKVYTRLIPKLLKNSRHVLTVSNTIKQEIYNKYKTDPYKITVVGNKVPQFFLETISQSPFQEKVSGFFLMVGTDNPRKNFTFVEEIIAASPRNIKLVVVGGKHRSFNTGEFQKRNSPNIIRLSDVKNRELRWLYENATALINPSLYEGFGIPNIEAMAFGCPVICSDIPVFREVCRDTALYFKLNDVSSFNRCITEAIENKEHMKQLTYRGRTIADAFQNQKRAQTILTILQK